MATLAKTLSASGAPVAQPEPVAAAGAADGSKKKNELTRIESNYYDEYGNKYPGPAKLAVIMASLYISIFLIALDRTIIGVAIPRLTDEFHSINDIGWYGSAYMLTACGFILVYGKIYTFFPTKWVFLTGIFLFEVGSALCGAAPSSTSFIVGRAIAGFGSSGIFTGSINILLRSVPLNRRPMFQGIFGACFGVASVAGPLIGGAFTQGKAGWRWCFYVNLPLGGFTIAALTYFLHIEENKPKLPLMEKLKQLDPLGTFFFLPSIVCLLLALQWGGVVHPWSDGRVVACLVLFVVLFLAFVAVQVVNRHTNATIPSRIFLQRSVLFGGLYQFLLGATMLGTIVYIPLWFQAIKGTTPVKSGIDTIPMVLGLVVMSILSGVIVSKIGYYTQFLYLGSVFMAIGAGLMTTLKPDSGHQKWIPYQAILGFGVGMGMQQSNLAVQRCLPNRDVPVGTSIIFFFQTFGGALFMSVAQNTFITKFIGQLAGVPGVSPAIIGQTGATALRHAVPPASLSKVIDAYNYGVTQGPFFVSMITGCLSILGAVGMEWLSVKDKNPDDVPVAQFDREEPIKDEEAGSVEEEVAANGNGNVNGAVEEKEMDTEEARGAPSEAVETEKTDVSV